MTATTPSGWYSSKEVWFTDSSPLRTRRGPSTREAFFAAQSRCRIASTISSLASPSGLPVSWCTSSDSRLRYRVRYDFQASSRSRRSFASSPAHHAAASRARCTAASTSAGPYTGKVAITSPVAGLPCRTWPLPGWPLS